MRIACRTHRGRGRAGAGCAIPASIGPALISARSIDSDIPSELSYSAENGEHGDFAEYPERPEYTELDEETLTALRLFAAEEMLAAVGTYMRESGEIVSVRRPADRDR
ncbi:hypothetical protein [Embleya sp. NBC_00896]|uniref:hypothetical protein n=1 Tax=Embleya sp. NBC_00896 TaxID=2975961 RepID=UPI003863782B|nr:hypothetical protein OG928_24110 [Embleya sp. NBC_00896]